MMHFGPEDDAGVSSQHSNTQSPAPGVAAEVEAKETEFIGMVSDAAIDANLPPHFMLTHASLLSDFAEALLKRTALQASAAAVPVGTLEVISGAAIYSLSEAARKLPDGEYSLYTAPPLPAQVQEATDPIELPAPMEHKPHQWQHSQMEGVRNSGFCDGFNRALMEVAELLASRTPAPGMAGGVGPASVESSLWTIKEWALLHLGPMHNITIAANSAHALLAAPHPSPAPQAAGAETEKAPRMNIFSQSGTQVIFDAGGGYPAEIEHAKNALTVGGVYTVERTEVGGCSSSVFLKGIDRGWNTVMFAAITASGRDAS